MSDLTTEPMTKLAKRYDLIEPTTRGLQGLFKEISNVKGELLTAEKGVCPRTIMLTSALPGEGKTIAAIKMARSLVHASHDRVLLIDAGRSKQNFDGWFNIDNSVPGLIDVLEKKTSINEIIYGTNHKQLDIAIFGDKSDVSTKTFESGHFGSILEELKTIYDFVIVDSPDFLSSSTAALMINSFDGIIVVVRCNQTRKQIVQQVMDKIDLLGGNIIGTILNHRSYYIPTWLYRWL